MTDIAFRCIFCGKEVAKSVIFCANRREKQVQVQMCLTDCKRENR